MKLLAGTPAELFHRAGKEALGGFASWRENNEKGIMKTHNTFYSRSGKRWFDLLLTLPGYVVISPLMGLIALLVRLQLGSPVLFKQVRPGLHGKPFTIYKFRTMTDARGNDGKLLPDAQRLTKLGRFLRATSLDEFPELWNVIKGEMSLVGPRPLLMQYLDRYTPVQACRHEAKPGLTGWAQVNGRNAITWEEKFELDVWYVDHCSVFLDIRIILMTLLKVVRREGIAADGVATMPEFFGSRKDAKAQRY